MGGATGYNLLNPFASTATTPAGSSAGSGSGAGLGSTGLGGGTGGGSIFNAGAYTPDWASLIQNDAGFLQDQSTLGASGVANASQRDASIQRALVNFGGNVDINSVAKSLGVDPSTLAGVDPAMVQNLAQANDNAGTSTQAQLSAANTKAVRGITNSLNARGLLNSGETGYQLGQQQQGYTQAQYDSSQKLMDYLSQYQQGYLSAQQQLAQQQAADASAAADRQYQANQGSAGTTADWSFTDASGVHVYKDASGNLFNPDGTKYTGSGQATPAPSVAPPVAPPTPPSVDTGTGQPVITPPDSTVAAPSGPPMVSTPGAPLVLPGQPLVQSPDPGVSSPVGSPFAVALADLIRGGGARTANRMAF
jgi:hypothetical protein